MKNAVRIYRHLRYNQVELLQKGVGFLGKMGEIMKSLRTERLQDVLETIRMKLEALIFMDHT